MTDRSFAAARRAAVAASLVAGVVVGCRLSPFADAPPPPAVVEAMRATLETGAPPRAPLPDPAPVILTTRPQPTARGGGPSAQLAEGGEVGGASDPQPAPLEPEPAARGGGPNDLAPVEAQARAGALPAPPRAESGPQPDLGAPPANAVANRPYSGPAGTNGGAQGAPVDANRPADAPAAQPAPPAAVAERPADAPPPAQPEAAAAADANRPTDAPPPPPREPAGRTARAARAASNPAAATQSGNVDVSAAPANPAADGAAPPRLSPRAAAAREREQARRAAARATAAEPPPHRAGFELAHEGVLATIEPPSHPGRQPVVAALDDRCAATAPVCDPSSTTARTFGWWVCMREAACVAGEARPVAAPLAAAVRTIESRHAGEALATGNVLVARGIRAADVDAARAAEPARWPYVLLIDPRVPEGQSIVARGVRRMAVVASRASARDPAVERVVRSLRERGVDVAFFVAPRASERRDDAVRHGLAWLFAGPSSDLCRRGGRAPGGAPRVVAACRVAAR